MTRNLVRALVAAGAVVLTSGVAARADETTFCNNYITSLPYTITTQGHYCFDRNLSTAITTGNAITINTDFVVLDLNNFKLGGGSAGLATQAKGIYSLNRSNITVRNGNIRGFAFGIQLDATTTAGALNNLIENNVVDGNTVAGIALYGSSYNIRNNTVTNTGGSTAGPSIGYCSAAPNPIATGIGTYSVSGCSDAGPGEVNNNTVINTILVVGATNGVIPIFARNGIALNNRVMVTANASQSVLWADVCFNNNLLDVANPSPYSCGQSVGVNSDF
jgi:parallel beta-helix repeat protein